MRTIMAFLLSIGICCADEVDDLIKQLQREVAAQRTELATARKALSDQRQTLHAKLATSEAARDATAKQIRDAQDTITDLTERIDATGRRRIVSEDALDRCTNLLRETRKDLQVPLATAAPDKTLFETTDAELTTPAPKPDALMQLVFDEYLQHLDRCTAISREPAQVILPDGEKASIDALRLGGIAAFSVTPEHLGILTAEPTESAYRLVPVAHAKAIRESLLKTTQPSATLRLPLDVSGGRGLKRLAQSKSLVAFLKAGGPVIIPLLILGLLALLMVIERTLFLLRVDKGLDRMLGNVIPALEASDFDGAMAHVEGNRGPVANVVRSALQHGRGNTDKLEELLQEGILAELPALERFLGALAVMAAAAPLLGLLGTVSGMIGTFDVISSYGTGHARLLSGGISEALITTEVGLIIAVPILLAHAFLNRQVRLIVGHMDRAALSLAGTIRHAAKEGENA